MARWPELWEPFGLARRMERLFDEFFRDWPFEAPAWGRADIYLKDGELVYEVELPGVRREDVHIKVENDRLIISGEVKRDETIKEENYIRMGRRYGKFQRSFPLPEEDIEDPKKIHAELRDGILRVFVPLKEEARKREEVIEIQVS